jgi:hypothetical protein
MFVKPEYFEFEIDIPITNCPVRINVINHYIELYEDCFLGKIFTDNDLNDLIENYSTNDVNWVKIGNEAGKIIAYLIWCKWFNDNIIITNKDNTSDTNFFQNKSKEVLSRDKAVTNWNTGINLLHRFYKNNKSLTRKSNLRKLNDFDI